MDAGEEEKKTIYFELGDQSRFTSKYMVCAVKLGVQNIQQFTTDFNESLIQIKKFDRIQPIPNNNTEKLILLNNSIKLGEPQFSQSCPPQLLEYITVNQLETQPFEVQVTYNELTYHQVMEKIIPQQIGVPTGFETVGTIAHLRLYPNQYAYKYVVGQVLLDQTQNIKTVVNQLDQLHNIFRTPELEFLAGVESCETQLIQVKVRFKLNFEKVYWNSRNQDERTRLLNVIQPGETILDLFCGIGPFALRAAHKGCPVVANDLNPYCFEFLKKNISLNSLDGFVMPFMDDARAIALQFMDYEYVQTLPTQFQQFQHVYMNLPVLSIDFLDVFCGFLKRVSPELWDQNNLPYFHVNCFQQGANLEECRTQICERIRQFLPNMTEDQFTIFHHIKNVTQNQKQFCVSFRLNEKDALEEPLKVEIMKIQGQMVQNEDQDVEFVQDKEIPQSDQQLEEGDVESGDIVQKKVCTQDLQKQ